MTAGDGRNERLAKLLTEARRLTHAQAGTVYLRERDGLHFVAVQNEALAARLGDAGTAHLLKGTPLQWRRYSIASYVALTGSTVNVADAYAISPAKPYSFDPRIDLETGFHTTSVLGVPLRSSTGSVYGVLQLINALNERGDVVPFDRTLEPLVEGLAAAALAA